MPTLMSSAYSSDQIAEYLNCIQLPISWHPASKPKLDLAYLTALHVHQISTIPYENLSLHYSVDKTISLDPHHLFNKFLHRNRGGYCLETSIFYHHILLALGFQVYLAAVSIRLRKDGLPYGDFVGWRHVVNIVRLLDDQGKATGYMIDVGFGGDGATKPLPLIHALEHQNLGTQTVRLVNHDEDTSDPSQLNMTASSPFSTSSNITHHSPRWTYQYRNQPTSPWNAYYAFHAHPTPESDFSILNFWLVHAPNFQRETVLAIKFHRSNSICPPHTTSKPHNSTGEEGNVTNEVKVTGKTMLVDAHVKINDTSTRGRTRVVQVLESERDRVAALHSWFGLVLSQQEADGIKGMVTELK